MKVIAVSGTPGTGKTTLSKKLAKKLGFYYMDVNRIISKRKLAEGYDKKRKTKIVNVKKLNGILIKEIDFFKKNNKLLDMPVTCEAREETRSPSRWQRQEARKTAKKENIAKSIKKFKGIIIDSHLSHYLPRKYLDFCIVTKCDIKELNRRLQNKKFNKNKILENIQAEIFDVCYNEALGRKHKIIVVDTTKSINISSIARKLGG